MNKSPLKPRLNQSKKQVETTEIKKGTKLFGKVYRAGTSSDKTATGSPDRKAKGRIKT